MIERLRRHIAAMLPPRLRALPGSVVVATLAVIAGLVVLLTLGTAVTRPSAVETPGSVHLDQNDAFDCLSGPGRQDESTGTNESRAEDHRVAASSTVDDTFAGIPLKQAIVTAGTEQYVGYYNAARRLTIGHRTLPDGAWQLHQLGGPDAQVGWDSHDGITLGVDQVGNLHVAGNSHGDPLRYWRTETPGDLQTLHRVQSMVGGSRESQVTYPQFLRLASGELVFSYREGRSGNGDVYFLALDTATGHWHSLNARPIFDGDGARSPYVSEHYRPDGYFYFSIVWRSHGDVATNSRLSLVRTKDFRQWQTAWGQTLPTPITYRTKGIVVDDVPENGGLFNNQEKVGVDADGHVAVAYTKYDPQGIAQLYLARNLAPYTWAVTQLTHWTGTWLVAGRQTLSVPVTFTAPVARAADTLVTYACRGRQRTVTMVDDSPGRLDYGAGVPAVPSALLQPTRHIDGLRVNVSTDSEDLTGDYYALTWDSLGYHNDKPRSTYPEAGRLVVHRVVRVAAR